jgi:hypothetical protein
VNKGIEKGKRENEKDSHRIYEGEINRQLEKEKRK